MTAGHLPKLTKVSETSLPKNFELAAGHLAIPLLLVATWFAILRRFDRAQPEPWWLVLATGAIAMAINPLTFYLRTPLSGTDWGDPHLADHAGRIEAFPAELVAYCMRAGLVEELVKLLPILMLARWRKEFDEPIDGIIYAVASAVGFSCIEEFGYLLFGRLHASLLVVRATSTPPAHVFFTSVMGYALGQGIGKGIRGAPRVVAAYLCAAFLHGLYDTLLTFRPLYAVSRAYQIVLLLLFTFLVRRALRGSSAVVSPSKNAKLVRAGTWLSFGFFLALFAFGVSSLREIGNLTPPISTLTNAEVVGLAVVLSAAIAIVALRMVSSVPLDVVIDDAGLTFSGVTWPWSSIGSASETPVGDLFPMRRRIILDTSRGPFILGPFTRTNASIVLAEIESRVPERQRVAPIPSVDVAGLRRAASDETDRAQPPQ
jgi:RsiW-degrading membrane proteinase PrsW (M82 family)